MPFTMSGDHATAVFYGDYIDYGSGGQGIKHLDNGLLIRLLTRISISANEARYVDVTPPQASRRFTGQQKYLEQLQECFPSLSWDSRSGATGNSRQRKDSEIEFSVQTRRCALLHGIGGVGKTQLALKFAEKTSKR